MLWDNNTRFIFTLTAAVIGLIAVMMIPNRKQIEERNTGSYERTGKWLVFVISFVIIGLAGVLGWEWFRYRVQNIWVGGNLAFFTFLGVALISVNLWAIRYLKTSVHVEVVEAEVVELSAEEGAQPGLIGEESASGPLAQPLPPPIELSKENGGLPKE